MPFTYIPYSSKLDKYYFGAALAGPGNAIHSILPIKPKPFTKRKSVLHKLGLKKQNAVFTGFSAAIVAMWVNHAASPLQF